MPDGDTSDLVGNAGEFDTVILTEYGNRIEFQDQGFSCQECPAKSLSGVNEDEVLVIESGNPTKTASGYGPASPPSSVTPVGSDRPALPFAPAAEPTHVADGGSWGDSLSPEQRRGCTYKPEVVRRELVHGSYEEHVYGDVYTTIEGTWFSKIKGNLWDTFYGFVHEDYNEHFEEIFYSTKKEYQKGDIWEYNHGKSYEYYYDDVTNEFGQAGGHITVKETYYGDKWQFCYGDESSVNLANKNDFFLGPMKTDTNVGAVTEAYLAVKTMLAAAITIECGLTLSLIDRTLSLEKRGMQIDRVDSVKIRNGGIDLSSTPLRVSESRLHLVA
ncbi:MAG: hypothetical protein PVG79_07005 [Gemmatimonadales bacterium]|jgi:hypothetical protein